MTPLPLWPAARLRSMAEAMDWEVGNAGADAADAADGAPDAAADDDDDNEDVFSDFWRP